jgi:hypothetical protein
MPAFRPFAFRLFLSADFFLLLSSSLTSSPTHAATPTIELRARIVAVGIPAAAGLQQVGMFHTGGPIPGNPEFLMQTRPGHMLDPERVLVTSGSNFGAPLADPKQAPGSILSIDVKGATPLLIPQQFAAAGGQSKAANGAIQLYTAQSPAFLNNAYNRHARTAALAAVSSPRYISINNAFGRPWIANSPFGVQGYGTDSVLDPNGRPLDNAPNSEAGGVFAAALTNRAAKQFTSGDLMQGALGTAFLGASPDSSGFAVFAVVKADGSVAQIHVQDGVDGLAPPTTVSPMPVAQNLGLVGIAFKWNSDRVLFIADAGRDRIAALHLNDDARHFQLSRVSYLAAPELKQPIDLAPAIPEIANPRFASHTTLASGSDLYIVNRGDGALLRMSQEGRVLARAVITLPGLGRVGGKRLRGIAVAADAQRIWLTIEGELPDYPGYPGALIELSAFDANGPYRHETPPLQHADRNLIQRGALAFHQTFTPLQGLGPLFNASSCVACHSQPTSGGTSTLEEHFALRVAHIHSVTGRLETLDDANSPIAHRHSIRDMGILNAPRAGIPRDANVTSLRMPPALYNSARLDQIPDEAILANAVSKGDGIHGRPNRVSNLQGEQRIGRYGWKSDIANIDEMVGSAYANELGISNPYAANFGAGNRLEDDGSLIHAVVAYLRSLRAPARSAPP